VEFLSNESVVSKNLRIKAAKSVTPRGFLLQEGECWGLVLDISVEDKMQFLCFKMF